MKDVNEIDYKKWVYDLESGNYPKCSSTLYDGHGYCCLGVLAVTQLGYTKEEIISPEGVHEGPQKVYDHCSDLLGVTLSTSTHSDNLTTRNDKSSDFKSVVDYIKEELIK